MRLARVTSRGMLLFCTTIIINGCVDFRLTTIQHSISVSGSQGRDLSNTSAGISTRDSGNWSISTGIVCTYQRNER